MKDSNEKVKQRKKALFPTHVADTILDSLTSDASDRLRNLAEGVLMRLLSNVRPLENLYALLDEVFEGDVESSRTYIRLFRSLDLSPRSAPDLQRPELARQRINDITPHPKLGSFLVNPIDVAAIVLGTRVASWTCQSPEPLDLWEPISEMVRQLDSLQDIHGLATRKKFAQLEALLVSISKESAISDSNKDSKALNSVDNWPHICYQESSNLLSLTAAVIQFCPDVVHCEGIESLDPVVGCSGDLLRIVGSGFNNLRPDPSYTNQRVTLRVDGSYVPMEEELWSDSEIQVVLPENIQTSNVGFVDLFFLQMYAQMQGLLGRYLQQANFLFEIPCDPFKITANASYLTAYTTPSALYSVLPGEYPPIPEPPFNGNNRLKAGRPVIKAFLINGAESSVIAPTRDVILEWLVFNAKSVNVQRTSPHGPDLDLDVPNPDYEHHDQHNLGLVGFPYPHTISYRLTAESYCGGPEEAEVSAEIGGELVIQEFLINGDVSPVIESNSDVVLEWSVLNAKSVNVQRIGAHGPPLNLDVPHPPYNYHVQHNLGPTGFTYPHTIRYRLTAEDYSGGTKEAEVSAVISVPAQVAITGCEFTQGIQHYGRAGKTDNSVPLIANKDTVIRLYTESLTGADIAIVSAHLSYRNSGGAWSGWLAAQNNPITVFPPGAIDRVQTNHTFNFLIPGGVADAGSLEVRFRLNVPRGVEPQTTNDEFPNRYAAVGLRPVPTLTIMRVRYNWNGNTPSVDDFNVRARSVRAMSPAADIVFRVPSAAHQVITTPYALDTDSGLESALTDLDAVADQYHDHGEYWIAMSTDFNRGMAITDGKRHICYVGDPADARDWARARTKATHELGHSLGLNHINTGSADPPYDPHVDGGKVLDIPFDSESMGVPVDLWDLVTPLDPSINQGIADVMGYPFTWPVDNPAPPPPTLDRASPRWTSAETWTRYYNQLFLPSTKGYAQGGTMHSGVNLYRFCGMLYADRRFTWIPGYPSIRTRGYEAPSEETTFGVRLLDADGRILIDYPVTVTWGNLGQDPALAYIKQFIPWNDKTERMEFYEKGSVIFAVDRSPQRPSIKFARGVEAVVRDAGEKEIRVSWTVDSGEESRLEYYLFFSGDDGESYVPLGVRLKQPEMQLRPSDLAGGKKCRLKVVATDGLNVAEAVSKSFALPIRKPAAEIHWPRDKSKVRRGSTIEVSGQGHFWAKRLQHDGKIEWFVNNKLVSNKRSFTLTVPDKGKRLVLKLRVTDDDGQTDEKICTLKIV